MYTYIIPQGELLVHVGIGANDATTSVICHYGNRIEDAVFFANVPAVREHIL